MRGIMVLNPKGGSGKSTLSTNLASYYASQGANVALVDYDPQGSASEWAAARSAGRAPIRLIEGWRTTARPPRSVDVVVYDVPAALHGRELSNHLRRAETFVVPVLPSPIDMRAARHFLQSMKQNSRFAEKKARFAVVANRVREHTLVFHQLERFLKSLKVPTVAYLRDSMNYVRAAERGIGVFEMAPYATAIDRKQWAPLLAYLRSKRSRT